MNDKEIRKYILCFLENNKYKTIEEFYICDGYNIADIVQLSNSELIGYEIKSDVDTFTRFKKQKESYDKTFDRNYLVVGEKYKDIKAPENCGFIIVSKDKIKIKKLAPINKKVSTISLLELLWKNELKDFLKLNNIKGYSVLNKRDLRLLIHNKFNINIVKEYVLQTLLSRKNWKE